MSGSSEIDFYNLAIPQWFQLMFDDKRLLAYQLQFHIRDSGGTGSH